MARIKDRNRLKKQFLGSLQKYCQRLEAENAALKGDPNTVIGQFIGQMNDLYSQNNKLSVLCATLLKQQGNAVKVTKDEMEAFKGMRLMIKWDLPEGVEKPEDASEYTFSYEAVPQTQPQAEAAPAGCTDPNCTLPKDLLHSHDDAPAPALSNDQLAQVDGVIDAAQADDPDVLACGEAEPEVVPGANTDGTPLVPPDPLTEQEIAQCQREAGAPPSTV